MSTDIPASFNPRDQELDTLRHENAALQRRIADLEATLATHTLDLAIGQSLRGHISNSGVFVFDADLRYLRADSPALAQVDIPVASIVGQTIWEALEPDVLALVEAPYRAALQGETTTYTSTIAGSTYRVTTTPVYDAAGQIIAGMEVLTDILAQVTAEQQLHIFEQIIANAPDGIFVCQSDLTVSYANAAMQHLLGQPSLIGVPITAVIAPEAYPQLAGLATQVESGSAWNGRLVYQRADGSTFPGRASVFSITNDSNAPFLVAAIVRDVTVAEQNRQQQEEQLLAAQQAIIRELATPLIPLEAEMIAMPLVGAIDTGRAQQITETLLEGIVTHQADYAILDITGVRMVDTQVAQALLRSAQAAKLLGAQVILSGLGAEIALALTHLGTDLQGIITVSTLQQGIAYIRAARGATTAV